MADQFPLYPFPDDPTFVIVGPAVEGCPHIGPEDGCCEHPDGISAECWRLADGDTSPCPLLATRVSADQAFWTHPQLPAEPGESEDDYLERFAGFMNANPGREIRGLE